MSDIGHNSDAAPIKVAGYFLEWRRVEDAKDELAEQSKALFKSMKDEGFDTKAARVAFREKRDALDAKPEDITRAEEAEAITDIYRAALDRGLEARAHPAPAHEKTLNNFGSYAAAKGVEQDDVGATASSTNPNSSDPLRSDKAETLPSSPEVSATNSENGLAGPACADDDQAANTKPAPISDEEFTPPAFLSRESKPLRPLCQNPDNCSGYGAKTCHACLKSAGVSYGASA